MGAFGGVDRSKLERIRVADAAHERMVEKQLALECGWQAGGQDPRSMQDAAISVAVTMLEFAYEAGITKFGSRFANHLLVAFGELQSGRHSALLRPANGPSNQLAASDWAQQGVAHACVETLREAGLSAKQARQEVSKMLVSDGFSKFSTHTLSAIQTRLTGPGSNKDPSYKLYFFAKQQIQLALSGKTIGGCYHPDEARKAVKVILGVVSNRDHRPDFFSDPGAE